MAERRGGQNNNKFVQILEKIRDAKNILVTVSNEPTIDEVAAALGLTVMLDKIGKRATAIYSGELLQNMSFLKSKEVFERNTHSLQEFIISIEKNKADSLRYKLEGDLVKIYLAPYKTKITKEDLNFSRGDYNVDMVILMNVEAENALDPALAEHVRILHNSTTVNLTKEVAGRLAQIEWMSESGTTMCEMAFRLAKAVADEKDGVSSDVASAFLTGIMAATDRFSNERTKPETMTTAAELMSLGANQQTIAAGLMSNIYGFVGKSKTEDNFVSNGSDDIENVTSENNYAEGGSNGESGYAEEKNDLSGSENDYGGGGGELKNGYVSEGKLEIINDGEGEYDEDGMLIEKNSKFKDAIEKELTEELPAEKAKKAEEELERAMAAGEEAKKQAALSDEIAEELRQVQAEMGGNLDETLENMKNENLNGVPPMGAMPPVDNGMSGGMPPEMMPPMTTPEVMPPTMVPPMTPPIAVPELNTPNMSFIDNVTAQMQNTPSVGGQNNDALTMGVNNGQNLQEGSTVQTMPVMPATATEPMMMPAEPMMTPAPFAPTQMSTPNNMGVAGGVAPIQPATPESANRVVDPTAFNIPGMG